MFRLKIFLFLAIVLRTNWNDTILSWIQIRIQTCPNSRKVVKYMLVCNKCVLVLLQIDKKQFILYKLGLHQILTF